MAVDVVPLCINDGSVVGNEWADGVEKVFAISNDIRRRLAAGYTVAYQFNMNNTGADAANWAIRMDWKDDDGGTDFLLRDLTLTSAIIPTSATADLKQVVFLTQNTGGHRRLMFPAHGTLQVGVTMNLNSGVDGDDSVAQIWAWVEGIPGH